MAYTSIIPVHRLDNSIDYVKDRKKTTKSESAGSLEEAIDYALNREKTEQTVFEDSIGCTCASAYTDMVATKNRFHKLGGVQGYHLIQSFPAGEVTPELAHLIGQELAEQLLKGQYEAVITTHLNTSHYHNHIVFNSVSMADGRKYHSSTQSYYEDIRNLSDRLCLKYGLSIIEPDGRGKPYAQWKAEQEGKPTWRTGIRMDIRESVRNSFTWNQFLQDMEGKGYVWKLNRKYIALKAPGMERFVRLKSLGKNYSEAEIRERILYPKAQNPAGKRKGAVYPKKKRGGLQGLYYSYLYQLGVFQQRPKRYCLDRTELRRLEKRIAQMEFLEKHGISSREELTAYRRPLEEEILSLTKERSRLYRAEPEAKRIGEITKALKPLRKEVKMCVQIMQQSILMEQKLKEAVEEKREKKYIERKPMDSRQDRREMEER